MLAVCDNFVTNLRYNGEAKGNLHFPKI